MDRSEEPWRYGLGETLEEPGPRVDLRYQRTSSILAVALVATAALVSALTGFALSSHADQALRISYLAMGGLALASLFVLAGAVSQTRRRVSLALADAELALGHLKARKRMRGEDYAFDALVRHLTTELDRAMRSPERGDESHRFVANALGHLRSRSYERAEQVVLSSLSVLVAEGRLADARELARTMADALEPTGLSR